MNEPIKPDTYLLAQWEASNIDAHEKGRYSCAYHIWCREGDKARVEWSETRMRAMLAQIRLSASTTQN